MEMQFGHERYWTIYVEDHEDGFAGLHIYRERFGNTALAATVIFWDASGYFSIQTLDGDVPVAVFEATIVEAKQKIPTR